jgi:hypothetical protein
VSRIFSLIKAVCESERIAWCGETDAREGRRDKLGAGVREQMRRFNLEVVLVALSALANGAGKDEAAALRARPLKRSCDEVALS